MVVLVYSPFVAAHGIGSSEAALLDIFVDRPSVVPQVSIVPLVERREAERRQVVEDPPSLVIECLAKGKAIVEPEGNLAPGYRLAKRTIDVVGAIAILVVLSPVLAAVLLILLFSTQGKPIFRQTRVGYRGRRFTMYKFRTMALDADRRQHEVSNEKDGPIFKNRRDPRVTPFGRFLRKTSIDEMPQLVNVLLGHMSLVGPRPPVPEEVARYEHWQRRRLAVMPGLTCLWQVSGRSEIGFADWIRMDLWYVKNQGVLTDLWLLLRTPWSVITGRGAY